MQRSTSLVFGLSLAVMVPLASVAPAYALSKATLTISANTKTCTYYTPATLTGTLKNGAGKALAGEVVYFEQSNVGANYWRLVKTLRTSTRGTVTGLALTRASLSGASAVSYRFRFAGTSAYRASRTTSLTISPRRIELRPTQTGSKVGRVRLAKGKALLYVYRASTVELTSDSVASYRALLGPKESTVSLPVTGYYSFYFPDGGAWKVIIR